MYRSIVRVLQETDTDLAKFQSFVVHNHEATAVQAYSLF